MTQIAPTHLHETRWELRTLRRRVNRLTELRHAVPPAVTARIAVLESALGLRTVPHMGPAPHMRPPAQDITP